MFSRIFPNDALRERELLQHKLTLAHRICQQDDRHNRAEIRASVAHRWPKMAEWIQEHRTLTESRYRAEQAHSINLAIYHGITEPWGD